MKKNIRPFSLENSGEDRPKMFLPNQKKRYSIHGHCDSCSHYQGIFRNSEQFITAIKLGREMLEDEGRPPTVLDIPLGEGMGEDDPVEEKEHPIQERDKGGLEEVNGAKKGPFNLKVMCLSKMAFKETKR